MKVTLSLLGVVIASSSAALGNGGGYSYGVPKTGALTGGRFQPTNIEQVEMRSERLNIDLHVEYAKVEVEYTLHNPGKALTIEAAFPCAAMDNEYQIQEEQKPRKKKTQPAPELRQLEITADRMAVEHHVVHDTRDVLTNKTAGEGWRHRVVDAWYVFRLKFKPRETRTVRVTYQQEYSGDLGTVSDDAFASPATFTYLFSTAALWRGPIRDGKVTVRAVSLPADEVRFNLAKRFQRRGNVWIWEFRDLEPTLADDLQIAARPAFHSYGARSPLPENDEEPMRHLEYVKSGGRWVLEHTDYTATATSTLKEGGDYQPNNVRDYDSGSAWVEGVPDDGIGECLTLSLSRPRRVTRIGIVNGLAKSHALYFGNNRVATVGVSVNGARPFRMELPDEFLSRQKFYFDLPADSPQPVRTLAFTIEKVHRGTQFRDTCISTIELVTPLAKAPKITPAR